MKSRELPPIRESKEEYYRIEAEILKILRREIYLPLLRELAPSEKLSNAPGDRLAAAIASGRLRYHRGRFNGKMDAGLSRELSKLGAVWDRATQSWGIPQAKLPIELRTAIQASEYRFDRVAAAIDQRLQALLPAQIAEKVKIAHFFDRTLFRIDQDFEAQVRNITVVPKLTAETRARVAAGYTNDLQKYISDFSEKEIRRLRKQIAESTTAGNRYEALRDSIRASYGVSENKAKFLARQETALMMTSFKTVRYGEAGITHYRWQSVIGSPAHPVRHRHKELNDASAKGKLFRFDDPPITSEPGEPERRNNPGGDFNCRCVARPVVKF